MPSKTKRPVPQKMLDALGRVFAAEIENRLPFQSKATIYRDLLVAGHVQYMERTMGTGWSAVRVTGYGLTHRGRYLYCASCRNSDEDV